MSISRRIATGAAAIALGGAGVATLGLAATGASAAPAHYPGGSRHVGFSRRIYHPGHHVHFRTGHHFKPHERVTEILIAPDGHRFHKGHARTHGNGEVVDSFKLGHGYQSGTYTLLVTGNVTGDRSRGHFHVT